MAVLVQKYGGSSVADVEKVGHVADRVVAARRAGWDVVVVVSAMGKSTDELLALAKRVAAASGAAREPREAPRRELDMLVSTGERVTMALLSIAISGRGEEAISFTGSQSGILTNDRHFDARIIEVRPHRIEDELARGRVVIVAGYQGMSYKREITTLGRGGSDTTAVALAAALSAHRCEIYSDVDGVYTADPRVVADAQHLPEVDFATLSEMSEAGAKVLNAQAVEWARRNKIALHARRTGDPVVPEGQPVRETVASPGAAPGARAVVGLDNVVRATVRGVAGPFLECAHEREVPLLDVLEQDEGDAFAVIPLLNVPDWSSARAALAPTLGGGSLDEELAYVSVVGDGLLNDRGLPRFASALASAGVRTLSRGGHALRLSALVRRADSAAAQRALHAAFVGSLAVG
ncbi:MAG: aspartate kinase [Myxococcales bacterium]|jgi:aspartate kinase|nr:aspartate kinase [Myxococcales bacterium]MBL0193956.1 aspartate kinase [Myxococcales bacterium]HQY63684.1 aspartate kinase [Polyangiaceae bacterium]